MVRPAATGVTRRINRNRRPCTHRAAAIGAQAPAGTAGAFLLIRGFPIIRQWPKPRHCSTGQEFDMTQKTGREQAHRKHDPSADAKQLHSPFGFNLRSKKNKTTLKLLSRGHRHLMYNRRISG